MTIYYVTHPNMDIKAKVEAPTTEKARTTFLDYLERQGSIQRSDRHLWRRSMISERLEYPEDVLVELELNYGYAEGGPPLAVDSLRQEYYDRDEIPPSGELIEVPLEREFESTTDVEPLVEEPEEIALPTEEVTTSRRPQTIQEAALLEPQSQKLSPIAQAARRGFK